MVRDIRVKEYVFGLNNLVTTASSTSTPASGLLDLFSDHVLNGTIQNVFLNANSFTTTGSLQLMVSGTNETFITLRAGSTGTFYPIVYGATSQVGTGSPQAFTMPIINAPLKVVGSGLGASQSGLSLVVRYI